MIFQIYFSGKTLKTHVQSVFWSTIMASILLLLKALLRCCHHELQPESARWKDTETKELASIIKGKKAEKPSSGSDNLEHFWSFLNGHKEETRPWKLAECCIWP